MNLRRKMRTDRRLWLACGTVVFVLLGFVGPLDGLTKAGPTSFWGWLRSQLVEPEWEWWRLIFIACCHAGILAIPAAAFGWVIQAGIVAVRSAGQKSPEKPAPASN